MAHILVVDDDDALLNFLTLALKRAGHTVTARSDGLRVLQEIADGRVYDVMLTDVVMPGIDGVELAERASKSIPALKVVFLTGFAAMTAGRLDSLNLDDPAQLFSKPYHLSDIVDHVEALLSSS